MVSWSKVGGLTLWICRVICIGTMVSASPFAPFARAQAVPTKSATIEMQPLKSASLVCGVALQMECPSCDENSWIEIAVRSAEEPSRTVHVKRVFTHGALFKNFYNIYFFDRARGAYVTPSDHCIQIPPDANFKVELSSSDTLSFERDSGVQNEPNRGSKHAKWLLESYGNCWFSPD